MLPQYIRDIQSYIESRPYGSVTIPEITVVNRKVTQITTEGRETLRYTDADSALADIQAILSNLKDIGYSGDAHIECTYKDGQITLLTKKQHAERHNWGATTPPEHLERIRELTKVWHRSEAGRSWHSTHGKQTWENRQRFEKVCTVCGKFYTAAFPNRSKYCHQNCKATALRRRRGIQPSN